MTTLKNAVPLRIPDECMRPTCEAEVEGSQMFRTDEDPKIVYLMFTCNPCGEDLERRLNSVAHGGIAVTSRMVDRVEEWEDIYREEGGQIE